MTTTTAPRATTLVTGLAAVLLLAGCAGGVPGAATAGSVASTGPYSIPSMVTPLARLSSCA